MSVNCGQDRGCTFCNVMIMITDYYLEQHQQSNIYYVRSREESVCPFCGNRLQIIGSRKRGVCKNDGLPIRLVIRRMKCVSCGHVHHELPDLVVPYKRYESEVVARIIAPPADNMEDYPCEQSTAKRLRIWFSQLITYLLELIYKDIEDRTTAGLFWHPIFHLYGSENDWLKAFIRWIVNSGWWLQTRSA